MAILAFTHAGWKIPICLLDRDSASNTRIEPNTIFFRYTTGYIPVSHYTSLSQLQSNLKRVLHHRHMDRDRDRVHWIIGLEINRTSY